MRKPIHLTNLQIRRFLLTKHGLWPPRALSGKAGVLHVFERLACIQFDPLNVVGRNPDLVLQSRVADYQPDMLYELIYIERQFYDYWDKMMSIVPMRDWPNFEPVRTRLREGHSKRRAQHAKQVDILLARIRQCGPMSSIDFDAKHDLDDKIDWRWGEMRAAKALLEMLNDGGELMVSHRQGTRRYYDLHERVVPVDILAQPRLTDEPDFVRWRVAPGEASPKRQRAIERLQNWLNVGRCCLCK